jgi:hypothetical protein
MRALLVLATVNLVLSLGACASNGVEVAVQSARMLEETWSDKQSPVTALTLQVDYTTTFNFEAHGPPIGFVLLCGAPRDFRGHPVGDHYALAYVSPRFVDASKVPGQIFTARYGPGGFDRFFTTTPSRNASPDGAWSFQFEAAVKTQGLCFYVRSGGTILNSPNSADVRIDGMLQGQHAPQ